MTNRGHIKETDGIKLFADKIQNLVVWNFFFFEALKAFSLYNIEAKKARRKKVPVTEKIRCQRKLLRQ